MHEPDRQSNQRRVWLCRVLATLVGLGLYLFLPSDVEDAARATAAIGGLMAFLWLTESLPLPVTALLPIALFPLAGVLTIGEATAPYASRFIFLFMGGFMLALAMERWGLHRRVALVTVLAVGTRPSRLVAGFMIATALLSMWISNTATTLIMVPIGVSVIGLMHDRSRSICPGLAPCLMLGIAYASSIGGVGTLVGTPPNMVLAGFVENTYGITIGFGRWMLFALPFVVVFLVISWLVMTRWIFALPSDGLPGGRELIRDQLRQLGPMSPGERLIGMVMGLTALAWIIREPVTNWSWLVGHVPAIGRIDDTMIAIVAAVSLFVIPVNARPGQAGGRTSLLTWEIAEKLPWGVLILFGGGLSLAAGVTSSGLSEWIGSQVAGLTNVPLWALVGLVAVVVIFLTELTSNVATATAFLPVLGGVALGMGLDPLVILLPAGLAASCAFMLPVATPPNAIVFASGKLSLHQMARTGLWLNLIGVVLITMAALTLGRWLS